MIYWFKRKYRQVKRVLEFLPIIWRGYDFDYRYAIDLFKYQLERTADFMESHKAMTVDADVRAKRIRTAIELLERVYDDEYGMEYQQRIKWIYGDNVLDYWFEDTGDDDGSSFLNMNMRSGKIGMKLKKNLIGYLNNHKINRNVLRN
jgi:hypothetical protein